MKRKIWFCLPLFAMACASQPSQRGVEPVPTSASAQPSSDLPVRDPKESRPWRAPDFSNQAQALGYDEQLFKVPSGLDRNVQFWIQIYSKYTTQQGVIHDSENIDLVYESLDFTDLARQADLTAGQKEKQKKHRIKEAKKRVEELLSKLERTEDPNTLNDFERQVWNRFNGDKKEFKEAAKSNRLRFQLGQRDRFIEAIYLSGRYLEDFEQTFKEQGLPIELTRLVFVESSFNVLARSKVGASGLWQIMPGTLKSYARKHKSIDPRNHPHEATKIAARILRGNYQMLQSWPLAITGYNHGPAGVSRLSKLHNTRDIGDLANKFESRKSLGFASRNFYASFLAALEVERNAPKYFGAVAWSNPLRNFEVKTQFPILYVDLVRWFGGDDLRTQIYNPHITKEARRGKLEIPAGFTISVPDDKIEIVNKEISDVALIRKARSEFAVTRQAVEDESPASP